VIETSTRESLDDLLARRILVLDGAMGTLIAQEELTEADYRGRRFAGHSQQLSGNHDLISLTRPDVVSRLHHAYLDAGADIIETNTISATAIAQASYGLEPLAYELNQTSAQLAKVAAREWTNRTPEKPRFVAGSIGPIRWKSSSEPGEPRVRPPIDVDRLRDAYTDQVRGLLDGGCDLLLIETIVDPLGSQPLFKAIKAAIDGHHHDIPLMLSVTLGPGSSRTLGGQTLGAFWTAVADLDPFAVGINCSFGARHLKPALADLANAAHAWVSCHPSAGLPNESGHYDEEPDESARFIRDAAREGLLNIAGGCCGTTPEHIRAIADALKDVPPRRLPGRNRV
jgi:5-methyltetrahydrofolate--homocysteine methyltransferase